ncbi:lysosome-associated membrane glycoprotein 2 isoform X3 [Cygnus olor]|uniref:lysosome-associated membrane glycoprotein 2 isoform X3 n=1 Tax=Cygnus olor TaxID=8869 RepID=UPI001ADEA419|nr:lysosome-associated membrane glycoprotein 2 isoform X3 [Cygnus olor]
METRRGPAALLPLPPLLLLLLLLLGASDFFQSYAVEVDVKDASNVTCLYAQWMMKFLIKYETNSSDYKNASLDLPSTVTHDGSVCGNDTQAALLAVQFGDGHSWSVNFTETNETYQADFITFTYNTNDAAVFPDAKRKGPVTVVVKDSMHPVQINNVFVCHHTTSFEAENVTQFFWNITMQPFVQNGTIGKTETRCHADTPTAAPTVVPTAANVTTTSTTTSSPAPTAAPKPVENPVTGNYSLQSGNKTCLLATVGLQLNVSQDKPLLININPKTTSADGTCGNTSATLKLNDGNSTLIDFTFIVNASASVRKFYLKEVNVTLLNHLNGSVILNADNNNFSKWDAFLGNSYMCRKEQTLQINEDLQVHTFNLWVQPFLVKENKFAIAQECSLDDDTILIPIVVGAALAGLIVIIVIAYIIGRRKSYAGYQTL